MSNFTKNAIKASFLKLLNERPLSKITIKDIVTDCGINRNSFYYHYQDIPSLIEEVIKEETDNIISQYPTIAYIVKYLEKTGEKLVYSKGLPQFFVSDIMEEDVVCPFGLEDKKLLLYDDFLCWDEGVLVGAVSKEVISQMPKAN